MKAVSIALFAGMVGCASVQPISEANAVTLKEKVLYSFCSQRRCADGTHPVASLIAVNGTLYGTTNGGGGGIGCGGVGCGAVFALDLNAGAEKVLYSFCRGIQNHCADGAYPAASLIDVNGLLYGTASAGGSGTDCGSFGCGTVFAIDPNTGIEKVLYSFAGGTDGQRPIASLIDLEGMLYGTTQLGGGTGCNSSGCGTVFSLDPNNSAEKVLYTFCSRSNCADGLWPMARLIAANGMLYGTTNGGGSGVGCGQTLGCGTVFSLDPITGAETVLYSFCSQANCVDGQGPNDSLIDVNGMLYGTTYTGGSANCSASCGTVFSLDPGTGAETVLHSFLGDGADGQWPLAGLIAVKGKLYGTTWYGGTYYSGTVFALDLKTNAETVVYSFCSHASCADGGNPEATLIGVDGELYGTTELGGAYCQGSGGCGTVFVLTKKR